MSDGITQHRLGVKAYAVRAGIWFCVVVGACTGLQSCGPGIKATKEETAALDRGEVSTPGVTGRAITYRRAGDPTAMRVIFIHGSPGDAEDYADYLVHPPAGVEVIAVDRLGFGNSTTSVTAAGKRRNDVVSSFAEQAAAIAPLLVQRKGAWPIVVGHSLGGPIAARLAADNPDRVGGLLILAGSLDPKFETPHWYNDVLNWWILKWMEPTAILHSNTEMMHTLEQTHELAGVLGKVRCPVIVMHGTADGLVPFGNTEYMKKMFTGVASLEIVPIPGEGHLLPWKQSDKVRELIGELERKLTAQK